MKRILPYAAIGLLQAAFLTVAFVTGYLVPAAAGAGVRDGDVLLAVDDNPVQAGASGDQVTALIRGPIGSTVRLKVRHASGVTETLTVTRQEIQLPSVTAKLIDAHADTGLIT